MELRNRSSHRRCSVNKVVLKNFAKDFTKLVRKHLCQSLFLIKLQASACKFIKNETLKQVFSSKLDERITGLTCIYSAN